MSAASNLIVRMLACTFCGKRTEVGSMVKDDEPVIVCDDCQPSDRDIVRMYDPDHSEARDEWRWARALARGLPPARPRRRRKASTMPAKPA
jgi:hypothetical protein